MNKSGNEGKSVNSSSSSDRFHYGLQNFVFPTSYSFSVWPPSLNSVECQSCSFFYCVLTALASLVVFDANLDYFIL